MLAMIIFDLYKYFSSGVLPDLFAVILYAALILIGVFSTVSAVKEAKEGKKTEPDAGEK